MLAKQQIGHVDTILDGVVSGWAIDGTGINHPTVLFVFIDRKPISNVLCSEDRPDITQAGYDGDRAGFRFRVPFEFLDDHPHEIAIRFPSGGFLHFSDDQGGVTDRGHFKMKPVIKVQGRVDGLVNGALTGWVVVSDPRTGTLHGGANVVITCEGIEVGRVKATRHRPDVGKSLSCDSHCGFSFAPPLRYRDGRQFTFSFKVASEDKELESSPFSFAFPTQAVTTRLAQLHSTIEAMSAYLWQLKRDMREMMTSHTYTLADYDHWARQYHKALRLRRQQAARIRSEQITSELAPLVSIICPVYRPRLTDFRSAVESVIAQTYTNWELILVDDKSSSVELTDCIETFVRRDPRIRALPQRRNGGISAATNAAIAAAAGTFIALFDHDDMLLDVALETMVEAARQSGAKLLYSDEDKIDDFGRLSEPNLKPDWNYRLLLAINYICHFLMIDAETLRRAGRLNKIYDGAQDHDLVLRLSEIVPTEKIHHVSEILYHWRKTPGSTATAIDTKSYAVDAGALAVRDHLRRRGFDAEVSSMLGLTTYSIDWRLTPEPKVCIIIPFREHVAITRRCFDALCNHTSYENLEIILVDNWSTSAEAKEFCADVAAHKNARVIRIEEEFNYSKLNNSACRQSEAEFFVFMNNDVFVEDKKWLRRLVDEALVDTQVGAVGAKLVYPNRSVQHGGVILGAGGVGNHAHHSSAITDPGFMGRGICAQELSAVTAALMLCRASAFWEAGGFDEDDLAVAYNDVDLCLKLRRLGYRVIWTPDVVAEHHESISRGDDMEPAQFDRFVYEEQTMMSRWRDEIKNDPFYNRHFSPDGGIFQELSLLSLICSAPILKESV